MRLHRSKPSPAAALLTLLLTAGTMNISAGFMFAKYGLGDLSENDLDQLAMLVDQLARVEAVLERCDTRQHYDTKLRQKVRPCIEAESIDRIQDFFDQRLQLHRESLDPSVCTKNDIKGKIKELKKGMTNALNKIGLMCKLCFFC